MSHVGRAAGSLPAAEPTMSVTQDPRTYTARWVFPVAGPPLPRGTVTVRGEVIDAVEPHGARTADADLGNVALIPGLVNPHTHLDLSGARGKTPPTDPEHFTDWLRSVIAYRRSRSPDDTQADIRAGVTECLRHGTTLLGDIASEGASWDAVAAAPVRVIVYYEAIGLSEERGKDVMLKYLHWISRRSTPTARVGYSPHAPYSAGALLLSATGSLGPTTVHLCESPGEIDLITDRTGPLVPFLRDLKVWESADIIDSIQLFLYRCSSEFFSAVLSQAKVALHPILLAHCNYLSADVPVGSNQSVVYCPRTHAAFGHPPHPFREFLRRGVRVCLGTDSLASNPDLDILAEARFVRHGHADIPGDAILRMVTLSGAEALGWANETGSLEPGKSADMVAVPLPYHDADPHELLLGEGTSCGPRRTMFRGEWRA